MSYVNFGSVTFWAGIAQIALGISVIALGDTTKGIECIMTGLAAIGIRHAITKVGDK
jgi:hypothetical protein